MDTMTKTKITVRRSAARGQANFGWLDSKHSFSFGNYYDPAHMGFSDLRVINQDIVEAGAGFGLHGHADMEIISYVMSGAVEHKDSIGTTAVIRPGELQRMTAGTGIRHSEYNPSRLVPAEFLQIWILPEAQGLKPSYEQMDFGHENRGGAALQRIASRTATEHELTVHQDVDIYRGLMAAGDSTAFAARPGRKLWLQVARGALSVDGVALNAGDGAAIEEASDLMLLASTHAEFLLFDLRG
jgi:quercetin 2,3-dioxygenase